MNIIIKIDSRVLLDRIVCMAEASGLSPHEFMFHTLLNALKSQDQTEEAWLENTQSDDLGTGIFLVPDVEQSNRGEVKKVLVPNITYHNCVQRGANCVYKWVPHFVSSYEELSGSVCGI